jgi:hypothetical protein
VLIEQMIAYPAAAFAADRRRANIGARCAGS